MNNHFKKGQYVLCKFDGKNGDLIVGRVDSVRSDGRVVLENLLTGHASIKAADVLLQRNEIVSKKTADQVIAAFDAAIVNGQSKEQARKAARALAITLRTRQLQLFTLRGEKVEPCTIQVEAASREEALAKARTGTFKSATTDGSVAYRVFE